MAELYEGLQGSGKSYMVTYKMHYEGHKYDIILTNIDGIKTNDKIRQIGFKKFTDEIIQECYIISVEQDRPFSDCIDFLKKMGILSKNAGKDHRTLIAVDEAQNFFGKTVKNNPALEWFITQHRHLYIELYLITQKHTLLRDNYKLFNVTYKAYPPTRQFNPKKIKYTEYAGLSSVKDNEVRTFSLKKEQKIFDMYESGDKVESPNILKPFLIYGALFIAVISGLIYYFTSNFGTATPPEKITEKITQEVTAKTKIEEKKSPKMDLENNKLYNFIVWDNGYFHISEIDEFKDYPIELLPFLQENFFKKVIKKYNANYGMTRILVICSKDLESFISTDKALNERTIKDFDLAQTITHEAIE